MATMAQYTLHTENRAHWAFNFGTSYEITEKGQEAIGTIFLSNWDTKVLRWNKSYIMLSIAVVSRKKKGNLKIKIPTNLLFIALIRPKTNFQCAQWNRDDDEHKKKKDCGLHYKKRTQTFASTTKKSFFFSRRTISVCMLYFRFAF